MKTGPFGVEERSFVLDLLLRFRPGAGQSGQFFRQFVDFFDGGVVQLELLARTAVQLLDDLQTMLVIVAQFLAKVQRKRGKNWDFST